MFCNISGSFLFDLVEYKYWWFFSLPIWEKGLVLLVLANTSNELVSKTASFADKKNTEITAFELSLALK